MPDRPPAPVRRLPRWSEVRPLLGFQPPAIGTEARLARAATIGDLRNLARRRTPRSVFDYTDGAADDESALTRCRDLYAAAEFSGRVLNDIARIDLTATVLGEQVAMPLVLGPTGFTRMMNHEGETAVAHEARRAGLAYTLSTMGTTPLERVAEVAGPSPHWFQLYLWQDRPASIELIERAKAAGYSSLVVTVDTAVAGNRLRDVRNGLTIPPRLSPKTFLDMAAHPNWWVNVLSTEPLEFASLANWEGTVAEMINKMFDPSVTWDDVAWLRETWPGKLVVKGIQTVADAEQSFRVGADAVLLSHHGGRQIGRARPSLRLLPEVREAVGPDRELAIDGGVMSGADIATALAHGADSVWIGRAYLYGLMAGGHLGVRRALEIFRTELTRTLQLLGVTRVADLRPEHIRLPAQL
ncbi:alpha-hydroxy-acid oxidizing enzyme [Enemella dayhoffiae]|uniref:Alpha-hydroxy-acid oxidizing enzyme n=2 Tax=Enemella dayhoffiae TaxID=2016507 RepID=A0A255GRI7_9ACTN|nr:alpha-hydroxy-acid oxidizing enzyme [Enemella dayhoffiae]